MTLKQWVDNRWLRKEATSRDEIFNLLAIVDRDMEDARFQAHRPTHAASLVARLTSALDDSR